MRGTNGPMDVITRAEFDDSMKRFATKDDLSEFVSAVQETIKDLRVFTEVTAPFATKAEMSNGFEGVTKAFEGVATGFEGLAKGFDGVEKWFEAVEKRFDTVDKGFEAVDQRFEAVDQRFEAIDQRFDGIDKRFDGVALEFLKMESRLDAMEHKINTVVLDGFSSLKEMMAGFTGEMREVVKKHERMLDRHDADLYKLRQSGVLQ